MYIPKNKIITNLYTNGLEINSPEDSQPLYIIDSNKIYTGYYWKDYKGNYYTGKNPNDKPTQELILKTPPGVNDESSPSFQTTPEFPEIGDFPQPTNSTIIDPIISSDYSLIRQITPPNINLPTQYFSKPTDENYKLGTFRRYFCVKANEQIFIEINEKTFTLLQTENEEWRWDLYVPFILDWVLTGNENNVRTTNFNSSKIIEVKEKGFQKFLRFNYLKFYQPPSKESTLSVPPRPSNNSTVDKSGNY
tara:strand:- start:315 stop:1061 length:747 start_codon:yes stop_codon:yes gene_type:complete